MRKIIIHSFIFILVMMNLPFVNLTAQQTDAIKQQAETQLQTMSPDEIDAKIKSYGMTRAEAEAKAKEIESAITVREGMINKQSNPIAKTLSYPIKKRASGF